MINYNLSTKPIQSPNNSYYFNEENNPPSSPRYCTCGCRITGARTTSAYNIPNQYKDFTTTTNIYSRNVQTIQNTDETEQNLVLNQDEFIDYLLNDGLLYDQTPLLSSDCTELTLHTKESPTFAVYSIFKICALLLNNNTLLHLKITGIAIPHNVIDLLINALYNNRSLQSLDLSECTLSDDSKKKLIDVACYGKGPQQFRRPFINGTCYGPSPISLLKIKRLDAPTPAEYPLLMQAHIAGLQLWLMKD